MKTASVTEVKAHLSQYLRLVQRGSEVQILDRGVPVARLVPATGVSEAGDQRLERLVAAGLVRRGSGSMRRFLATPPLSAPGSDVRGALDADREERV